MHWSCIDLDRCDDVQMDQESASPSASSASKPKKKVANRLSKQTFVIAVILPPAFRLAKLFIPPSMSVPIPLLHHSSSFGMVKGMRSALFLTGPALVVSTPLAQVTGVVPRIV